MRKFLSLLLFVGIVVAGPAGAFDYDPDKRSPHYYRTTIEDTLTAKAFGDTPVSVSETIERGDLVQIKRRPDAFHFALSTPFFEHNFARYRAGSYTGYRKQHPPESIKHSDDVLRGQIGAQARRFRPKQPLAGPPALDRPDTADKTAEADTDTQADTNTKADTQGGITKLIRELRSLRKSPNGSGNGNNSSDVLKQHGLFAETSFTPLYGGFDVKEGRSFSTQSTQAVAGVPVNVRVRFTVEAVNSDTIVLKGTGQGQAGSLGRLFYTPFKNNLTDRLPETYKPHLYSNPDRRTSVDYEVRYVLSRRDGMVEEGEWTFTLTGTLSVDGHEDKREELLSVEAQSSGSLNRRGQIETKHLPRLELPLD